MSEWVTSLPQAVVLHGRTRWILPICCQKLLWQVARVRHCLLHHPCCYVTLQYSLQYSQQRAHTLFIFCYLQMVSGRIQIVQRLHGFVCWSLIMWFHIQSFQCISKLCSNWCACSSVCVALIQVPLAEIEFPRYFLQISRDYNIVLLWVSVRK